MSSLGDVKVIASYQGFLRAVAARLRFPVGLLGNPWAGGYGRIWKIPVSFVIDRAGRLAYNGWEDQHPVWTKERLTTVVDPLLMQSSGRPGLAARRS